MKLCKDILTSTSSSKIAFNTLYEKKYSPGKKEKKKTYYVLCWYYQIICNISTPDTAALHRTVTSRERLTCNHYTIPMTCSTVVHHLPLRSLESHSSHLNGWIRNLSLDPSFHSINWVNITVCCFHILWLTLKYPPQQLLVSSVNVWIQQLIVTAIRKGYRLQNVTACQLEKLYS